MNAWYFDANRLTRHVLSAIAIDLRLGRLCRVLSFCVGVPPNSPCAEVPPAGHIEHCWLLACGIRHRRPVHSQLKLLAVHLLPSLQQPMSPLLFAASVLKGLRILLDSGRQGFSKRGLCFRMLYAGLIILPMLVFVQRCLPAKIDRDNHPLDARLPLRVVACGGGWLLFHSRCPMTP